MAFALRDVRPEDECKIAPAPRPDPGAADPDEWMRGQLKLRAEWERRCGRPAAAAPQRTMTPAERGAAKSQAIINRLQTEELLATLARGELARSIAEVDRKMASLPPPRPAHVRVIAMPTKFHTIEEPVV